jgi:hypothetical protein
MNCHNNEYYYAYILIITKQLTYDNENSTKKYWIHARIVPTLKIILNQMKAEADMKDCQA